MMDRALWERIQELFHRTADLPEAEREQVLKQTGDPELADRVRAMIAEDARGGSLLDRDVSEVAGRVLESPGIEEIGRYRVRGVLGEGGMGVVYLAERKDLGNLVALKILRDAWLSPARRKRFAAEQKTLAQLNHPSIARLYDADTLPDGTPWFVMEYVDGVPLTDYAREHGCGAEEKLKLFRAVCEAVAYAHEHAVVHRDLKPSNILVKNDGSVRLLDFGIAKNLDAAALNADQTRTGMRLMTPAYAAPEQVRGQGATVRTDVYSLGVILYELLAGKLPFDLSMKTPAEAASTITMEEPERPSQAARSRGGEWTDLDALCLAAMEKDPERRYATVEALIGDVDRYLNHQPLEARRGWIGYSASKFARRNWKILAFGSAMAAAVVVMAVRAERASFASPATGPARSKTVAILQFQNAGADHGDDVLGTEIASEIARMLDYGRTIAVRPFGIARQYANTQMAGRALHAGNVLSGHFKKSGGILQVTMDVEQTESAGSKSVWEDAFEVPADDSLALERALVTEVRGALGTRLGATGFTGDFSPGSPLRARNREAYDLYLSTIPGDVPTDEKLAALKRSLELDPEFAPALHAMAGFCTVSTWYERPGEPMDDCVRRAQGEAVKLDPDSINTYYSIAVTQVEVHDLEGAYRAAKELLRRRPDHSQAHLGMAYMLRYAGLLDEAERECETGLALDPENPGYRSCANAFLERGDYSRAEDFLRLDLGSEFQRATSMDVLLREGKEKEAYDARPAKMPEWGAYPFLYAYLEHRPAEELHRMAAEMKPVHDPEMNYFAGAHLAYAGETEPALTMLRAAIGSGYCSYPAMDSDPLWGKVRGSGEFQALRSAGMDCRSQFLAQKKAIDSGR
jgi:predicted Ser/Thr protein kinase/TolB-like protein